MTKTTYLAPQQPQEPKKKRGVLKWILIVVGTIVALSVDFVIIDAVIGGEEDTTTPAGSSNAPSDKPSPNASEAPTAKIGDKPSPNASEVPTAKIGDKVTDESYQFTVSKISCGVGRVGSQYFGEKAQGQFCMVSLKVKNLGKEPINYSSKNQALVDTKDRTYSPDDGAWIGEINPGNTLKTVVPFDIPKKAKPDYLLLTAGVWGFSEGVRVKL
jgi:hypothetical protein